MKSALKLSPPFTRETAIKKIRAAENAWNSRDPERVSQAYSLDTSWRNRSQFVRGRDQVREFLRHKWETELDYRLVKEIWAFGESRIAVRFAYEYRNPKGLWFRAYGNGLMRVRHASINDLAIEASERKFHWNLDSVRPDDHPGLTALGL